jgi:glycosyltransferase involved in cell wall biosynthesis
MQGKPRSCDEGLRMNAMNASFCIITGGRSRSINLVIESIRAQRIPKYEIIIVGKHHDEQGIVYLPAFEEAESGRLGRMRNLAMAAARLENIVIMDDDIILSPSWYESLLQYVIPFDILTSQVRDPDGTRYWDHATYGGPRGHILLENDEEDDHIYMTGGGAWIMKKYVADTVKWDETRVFNEQEDSDFSARCRQAGFRISHNHQMLVFHDNDSYTSVGRVVLRRSAGRQRQWIVTASMGLSVMKIIRKAMEHRSRREFAEEADYLRAGMEKYPRNILLKMIWYIAERRNGGELAGTKWFSEGDPLYNYSVAKYRL